MGAWLAQSEQHMTRSQSSEFSLHDGHKAWLKKDLKRKRAQTSQIGSRKCTLHTLTLGRVAMAGCRARGPEEAEG